jgi:uncharacterized protein (TIGR00304 family)
MLDLVSIGMVIIIAGFLVVFVATLLSARASDRGGGEGEREARVRGGGVVMIGPIPIIFGSDAKWASIAVVLAILLIVIVFFSGALVRR